jgi:uncharacterized UBP type Zn finger protein
MSATDDWKCSHLRKAARRKRGVQPSGHGCVECLATSGIWVHLRLCLECGHVGCCDNSPGKHTTAHYRATGHTLIRSYEPEEPWAYCFADDAFAESLPAFAAETAPHHFDPP